MRFVISVLDDPNTTALLLAESFCHCTEQTTKVHNTHIKEHDRHHVKFLFWLQNWTNSRIQYSWHRLSGRCWSRLDLNNCSNCLCSQNNWPSMVTNVPLSNQSLRNRWNKKSKGEINNVIARCGCNNCHPIFCTTSLYWLPNE